MFNTPMNRASADALLTFLWRTLLALAAIGLAGLIAVLATPAHAQEAASATTFDFGPWALALIEFVAPTILGIVAILATWILQRLGSWLGLKIDDTQRDAVNQGLERAVSFAMEKLADQARGGIPIDLKQDAIMMAAGYAQRSIPGALKHFNVDSRRLSEMVESRLQGLIFDPEVVPEGIVASPLLRTAHA